MHSAFAVCFPAQHPDEQAKSTGMPEMHHGQGRQAGERRPAFTDSEQDRDCKGGGVGKRWKGDRSTPAWGA